MNDLVAKIGEALIMAFGMFWKTGWSLVLGFTISAVLQAVVSKERMRQALGRDGPKEVALASVLGAASSSCSYASAAQAQDFRGADERNGARFSTHQTLGLSQKSKAVPAGVSFRHLPWLCEPRS